MKKIWISVIIGIVLIGIVFAIRPAITGNTISEKTLQMNEFAQCLSDAGAIMYGTSWCTYCQKQKKDFGKSFKYVNYVDCDKNYQECQSAGVQGYPTWKINDQNYPGIQTFITLGGLTSCQVPL